MALLDFIGRWFCKTRRIANPAGYVTAKVVGANRPFLPRRHEGNKDTKSFRKDFIRVFSYPCRVNRVTLVVTWILKAHRADSRSTRHLTP